MPVNTTYHMILDGFINGIMASAESQLEAINDAVKQVLQVMKIGWPEAKETLVMMTPVVENGTDFIDGIYFHNEEVGFHFKIHAYVEEEFEARIPGWQSYDNEGNLVKKV